MVVASHPRTYRSRLSPYILHEDTSEELEGETPSSQQHVVRDHHAHEAAMWTEITKYNKSQQSKFCTHISSVSFDQILFSYLKKLNEVNI